MDYTIRQLFEKVLNGQIRIPPFQRGFVWEADMVAYLMDSIYKGYPFGTLMFWRSKQFLKAERKLGPFELITREPDLPIDYVLDGQQRITSIFGVFQNELTPVEETDAFDIYFDFTLDDDAQETQFFALTSHEVDPSIHFPLKCLFDSVAYREATAKLPQQIIPRIDELQTKIKEARIPVQILETEDRAKVAIVFERINRKGVELDTYQLLNAWTWSEDFNLESKFEELKDELQPFGFNDVGEDVDLILRCCSAILSGNASARAVIDLNGNTVRDRFDEIINGLKGAIDFLKSNFKIEKLENLPYPTLLIPLAAFFAAPNEQHLRYSDDQRKEIVRWFWKSSFSKRYSAGVLKNLNRDVEEIRKLKEGKQNQLSIVPFSISADFFKKTIFRINAVNTKSLILLLARKSPRSFITGGPISLRDVLKEYNRNEFHHLFPRKYLRNREYDEKRISCLSNFCFMSKGDNNQLGGEAPSKYRTKMPPNVDQILDSAITPFSLFDDDFESFLDKRTELLINYLNSLLEE
jgi:hypothetical protein